MWRRGSAPSPRDADHLLAAGRTATRETLAVIREGYRVSPNRENALFNMLAAFALTFGAARGATALIRSGRGTGLLRDVVVADRHIHHVPGFILGFASRASAGVLSGCLAVCAGHRSSFGGSTTVSQHGRCVPGFLGMMRKPRTVHVSTCKASSARRIAAGGSRRRRG